MSAEPPTKQNKTKKQILFCSRRFRRWRWNCKAVKSVFVSCTVTFCAVLRGVFVYSGGKKWCFLGSFQKKNTDKQQAGLEEIPQISTYIYTHTALMYKRICFFVLVLSPSLSVMCMIDLLGLHPCVVWFNWTELRFIWAGVSRVMELRCGANQP